MGKTKNLVFYSLIKPTYHQMISKSYSILLQYQEALQSDPALTRLR